MRDGKSDNTSEMSSNGYIQCLARKTGKVLCSKERQKVALMSAANLLLIVSDTGQAFSYLES